MFRRWTNSEGAPSSLYPQPLRGLAIPFRGYGKTQLLALEAQVCELAPDEMTRWNNARVLETEEPTELLDSFLLSLGWPDGKLAAVERQANRWKTRCS